MQKFFGVWKTYPGTGRPDRLAVVTTDRTLAVEVQGDDFNASGIYEVDAATADDAENTLWDRYTRTDAEGFVQWA